MLVDWLTPASPSWGKALAAARHDVYHLPAYVAVCADGEEAEPGAIYIEEDGHVCLWPLLERRIPGRAELDVASPYGYPGPIFSPSSDERRRDLLQRGLPRVFDMLRARGDITLFSRLHPILDAGVMAPGNELPNLTVVEHGATVSIDLTLPLTESFAQYRETARRHVRLARRYGFAVTRDEKLARLDDFIAIYRGTMKRIGASEYYLFSDEYFTALREALGPRVSLWFAEHDGRIGAAVMLTEVSGILQYHLSANDAELSKHHPTKLLIDEIRCWGHARGAEMLHLGGGVGGSTEDSLFFFKAGFSDRRHSFRTARAVLNPDVYTELNRSKPVDPRAANSGFFPAYRER